MAILGGVGNPVGGSFTGPAETLEIIGDHCAAYSGTWPADADTTQTVLNFTTGNFYIVGEFQLNAPVDFNSPQTGNAAALKISFNDSVIAILKGEESTGFIEPTQKVVIPAYTEVKCEVESDDNQSSRYGTVSLIGRIYRSRD